MDVKTKGEKEEEREGDLALKVCPVEFGLQLRVNSFLESLGQRATQ